MPLLFSYINKETDPDNLWKIQRRVAKSLREANDDDRGLAETADMSEDTDDIIDKINKIVEQTINISNTLLNERSKIRRPTDSINTPDFNISNLEKFITDFNKLDVNKMNANNIQKLTDAKNKLDEFIGGLYSNLTSFKTEVDGLEQSRRGRRPAGTPPPAANQLSVARQQELETFFEFYDSLIDLFRDVLNQMDLKLSNYRQTARVLTQEGVEPVKTGGCMYCDATPIEYRPQYQNRMYY
jgi:hypothetical protein